mmetsp:Transcript_4878/g.14377  ORF Transcript_4878/g.14377 Transcript_4878/m.14377 type:complete len:365 (-) Transcript_4878:475-1569(-)
MPEVQKRWRPTEAHRALLMDVYSVCPYPDRQIFAMIAHSFGVDVKKVALWFQNHRQRQRREHAAIAASPWAQVHHSPSSACIEKVTFDNLAARVSHLSAEVRAGNAQGAHAPRATTKAHPTHRGVRCASGSTVHGPAALRRGTYSGGSSDARALEHSGPAANAGNARHVVMPMHIPAPPSRPAHLRSAWYPSAEASMADFVDTPMPISVHHVPTVALAPDDDGEMMGALHAILASGSGGSFAAGEAGFEGVSGHEMQPPAQGCCHGILHPRHGNVSWDTPGALEFMDAGMSVWPPAKSGFPPVLGASDAFIPAVLEDRCALVDHAVHAHAHDVVCDIPGNDTVSLWAPASAAAGHSCRPGTNSS